VPHCVCALELRTGQRWEGWVGGPDPVPSPPWDPETDIILDYNGTAEHSVFAVVGWQFPKRHWDWLVELKVLYGCRKPSGSDNPSWALLELCAVHGIATIEAQAKEHFRGLAMRGGPYTAEERRKLLDYCWSDVEILAELFNRTAPKLNRLEAWVERAYFRGAVVQEYTRINARGIPIDGDTWAKLRKHWHPLINSLTAEVAQEWPVFVWNKKLERYSVNLRAWADTMRERGIPWPTTETGKPSTDDDTLKSMTQAYPVLRPLREVMSTRGQFRLGENLAIGKDNRNRADHRPFTSSTGRCQPSNSKFVFGTSTWLRSIIKPPPGMALAYVDLAGAEIALAALLAQDGQLWDDYDSGDPYTRFGLSAGLIPPGGTKKTHPDQRDLAKRLMLAVGYGMGPASLARNLGVPEKVARQLMQAHKLRYPHYWTYSQQVEDQYTRGEVLTTRAGWRLAPELDSRGRPLVKRGARGPRNFPMQAHCAAILHRAILLAARRGIQVVCSVHDALLVQARESQIERVALATEQVWKDASRLVMGRELRSDSKIVRSHERYEDGRGVAIWQAVVRLLGDLEYAESHPPVLLPFQQEAAKLNLS
jgi:DNA polymerase-1